MDFIKKRLNGAAARDFTRLPDAALAFQPCGLQGGVKLLRLLGEYVLRILYAIITTSPPEFIVCIPEQVVYLFLYHYGFPFLIHI